MKEIERKFIVSVEGSVLGKNKGCKIVQGYFFMDGCCDKIIRIRIKDDKQAYVAIKIGKGLVKEELEHEISIECAKDFLAETSFIIEKIRYKLGRWEIDVFEKDLFGLIIGECELASEDEKLPLLPDGIKIKEKVTDDVSFANSTLAKKNKGGEKNGNKK